MQQISYKFVLVPHTIKLFVSVCKDFAEGNKNARHSLSLCCLSLCFVRNAVSVTSEVERWKKPKMTSETGFCCVIISAYSSLISRAPTNSLSVHLNHRNVLICVCVCVCRWAHVMCAVALPEARFSDEAKRSPIDTSRIPMQRYKLVSARAHTHKDAVLEFPRSLRTGSV